jgi:hypothetical protein
VVSDRGAAAWPNGQRGEELVELVHQEEAPAARHRPRHPQAAGRRGGNLQRLGRVHRCRAHRLVRGPAHAAAGTNNGRRKLQQRVQPQHQRRRVQRRVPVAVRVQPDRRPGRRRRLPGPGRAAVAVELQHAELDGRPKPRGHHHHDDYGRAVQQRVRVDNAELLRRPPAAVAGAGHDDDEQLLRCGPVRRGAGRAEVVRLRVRRLRRCAVVPAAGTVQHLRRQQGRRASVRRRARARQLVLELSQRRRPAAPKSITIECMCSCYVRTIANVW